MNVLLGVLPSLNETPLAEKQMARRSWYILGFVVALMVVVLMSRRDGFMVPVKPSREQDQKLVTPAGNVITY
jgi:hypothetical protein